MASSFTLQSVVDYARTFSELTPVLAVGGSTQQPALTIAQDVITRMLSPTMPWKWNRLNVPPFYTNGYQQDYGVAGLGNLKWLENANWVDINNTSTPKPQGPIQVVRDIPPSSALWMPPSQLCWLPNGSLSTAAWPGAAVVYANPVGVPQAPNNPRTLIADVNGNILLLTQYGTTGAVAPLGAVGAAPGTVIADGTAAWTVLDPAGQGFRLNAMPTLGNLTYQVNVIAQMRAQVFTSLSQKLTPIPDDDAPLFRKGFVAFCYLHSPEEKIRARFQSAYGLWQEALMEAVGGSNREQTEYGFYPAQSIADGGYCYGNFGPAWPYPPGV